MKNLRWKRAVWSLRCSIDHDVYYRGIVNGEFAKKMGYTYCRAVSSKGYVETYANGYPDMIAVACMI